MPKDKNLRKQRLPFTEYPLNLDFFEIKRNVTSSGLYVRLKSMYDAFIIYANELGEWVKLTDDITEGLPTGGTIDVKYRPREIIIELSDPDTTYTMALLSSVSDKTILHNYKNISEGDIILTRDGSIDLIQGEISQILRPNDNHKYELTSTEYLIL